jgi:nitroreductase
MVMVASDGSAYASMDCGILSQNVALAAHSLGLGSVICGMAGISLSGSHANEFKSRMGFPEGYVFGIAILVGTANTTKEPHELDRSKATFIEA